jgi:adenosylcobinamide kinase / adenosylcobinamide-phosphate guanylyltransferase
MRGNSVFGGDGMGERMIFLLGGARSGKSYQAEQWAREHGKNVLFVATAQAFDDDMRERITRHRAQRPAEWHTLEVPLGVGEAILRATQQATYDVIVVDCLTLLASNALLTLPENATQAQADDIILQETRALLDAYAYTHATWLIVSNEVGMGVVPATSLGRLFRDALGRANQQVATRADDVWLLVAGLIWKLKP